MNITISGASGLVGRRLLRVLGSEGHKLHVLSRYAGTNLPQGVKLAVWDPESLPPITSLESADAVIQLAGEPVAQRWTTEVKRRIRESRVGSTERLVEAISKLPRPPRCLVCASAIGYYGSRGDEILEETSPPGSGFLPEVCLAWEKAAQAASGLGVRVAVIRIGVVLDKRGGALGRLLALFRAGLGGRLGSGRQWMSWIHAGDLAELFRFVLDGTVQGAVNGVAPFPVSNAEFTQELARVLKRPALLPVPGFLLKAVLGDMAEILLASQRVAPRAAESTGFRFRFPQLGAALAELLVTAS
jgi:uncharacterized protein (TIGR01777 family)